MIKIIKVVFVYKLFRLFIIIKIILNKSNHIMAKTKKIRIILKLECIECRNLKSKIRKPIYRYTTTKNRKNTPERIELKKFCRYCNKHQLHKEIK